MADLAVFLHHRCAAVGRTEPGKTERDVHHALDLRRQVVEKVVAGRRCNGAVRGDIEAASRLVGFQRVGESSIARLIADRSSSLRRRAANSVVAVSSAMRTSNVRR